MRATLEPAAGRERAEWPVWRLWPVNTLVAETVGFSVPAAVGAAQFPAPDAIQTEGRAA